jgi:hypothetical protein
METSIDMKELRTVLDLNECTLTHLTLGGFDPLSCSSCHLAFESETINNLTHLDLVDTSVSHFMLTRIASAHRLQSLTFHGEFVDPDTASVVFASDRIVDGSHTLWPHLEAFRLRFPMRDGRAFYQSVGHFSQKREKLRRLDLGCPWHLIHDILPTLQNLRVLSLGMDRSSQNVIKSLVDSLPRQMVAITVFASVSDKPLVHTPVPNSCVNRLIYSLLGPICLLFCSLQHPLLLGSESQRRA